MSEVPLPSDNSSLPRRRADFATLAEALDYAAQGETGITFYSVKGEPTRILPYAEARQIASARAQRLASLGINPGDRMILLADTDPDFFITFMACQYAGVIPAPVAIPTVFGEKESYIANLVRQITDSGAKGLLTTSELADMVRPAAERTGLAFCGTGADIDAASPSPVPLQPFGANDISYLQYSSGSTRDPQGIIITQKAITQNAFHTSNGAALDVRPGDRACSWLPLYHDMGLVGFLLTPMTNQLSIDLIATRDFARRSLLWLQIISQNRATLSYSPSFGYDLCVRRAANAASLDLDLSSWRVAGIGGDMIRPQILESFAERFSSFGFSDKAFTPSYGLAEITLAATFAPLGRGIRTDAVARRDLEAGEEVAVIKDDQDDGSIRRLVVCGRILPDHGVEIRDADGKPLPERRLGRVFLKGPSMMGGYYQKPDATRRILSEDGWLDTGDLGYVTDGELVITGRDKDLILINGRNIWPQDIEWAVEAMPQLRRGDAAAFSVDTGAGETVTVLIQCRPQDDEARRTILDNAERAARDLGIGAVAIHLVPPRSLPQTSSGKLSRAKAKARFLGGGFAAATDLADTD